MDLGEALELQRGWDPPKFLSLLANMAKVDPKAADKIAAGEATFQLIEIIRTLVDRNGIFIPETFKEIFDIKGDFKNPDKKFSLEIKDPAKIDYREVIGDIAYDFKNNFPITISAQELFDRGMKVVGRIKTEEKFAPYKNLLNGPIFFSPIPQIKISGDHGKILQDLILPALERAYLRIFPERKFNNYLEGKLENKVNIISGMRYEKFIAAMEQGGGMFVSFPGCFQGFSPVAEREVISHIPEEFILSGIYDMPIEMMGHTKVFTKDFYTLGRNVSSAQWQSAGYSLGFEASGGRLVFDYRNLGASDYCSGGLLFLG